MFRGRKCGSGWSSGIYREVLTICLISLITPQLAGQEEGECRGCSNKLVRKACRGRISPGPDVDVIKVPGSILKERPSLFRIPL
jgi:hypothetical protein